MTLDSVLVILERLLIFRLFGWLFILFLKILRTMLR